MTDLKRVLVLAPMTSELKPLLRSTGARPMDRGGVRYYEARLGDTELVMLQVGVGPSVAQANTARALGEFEPEHVFVSGIAGGLAPEAAVGAIVIPVLPFSTWPAERSSGRRFRPDCRRLAPSPWPTT